MPTSERVTIKEFTPEQAGQRVGWSNVVAAPEPEYEDYAIASLAVATVGKDGAKLSYHPYERDGEVRRALSSNCAEGFVAITGLSLIVLPREGVVENGGGVFVQNSITDSICYTKSHDLLMHFAANPYDWAVPNDEERKWGENPAEILAGFRDGLDSAGLSEHYSQLYYLINGYIGHELYAPTNPGDISLEAFDRLLPDPSQIEQTEEQHQSALGIVQKLKRAMDGDQKLEALLSDIPGEVLPVIKRAFVESRQQAHRYELGISADADSLLAPGLVFTPTGVRPNGRSWYYMDAAAKDERVAFGLELDSLEAGTSRVVSELARELRELELRLEYAEQGQTYLAKLRAAEQHASGA